MVLPKGKDGRVRHVRTLDEELVPLKAPFYDGAPVFVKKGVHRGMRGTIVEVCHFSAHIFSVYDQGANW